MSRSNLTTKCTKDTKGGKSKGEALGIRKEALTDKWDAHLSIILQAIIRFSLVFFALFVVQ
jgi:hypothetical protein